jgi:hypothetical protein
MKRYRDGVENKQNILLEKRQGGIKAMFAQCNIPPRPSQPSRDGATTLRVEIKHTSIIH